MSNKITFDQPSCVFPRIRDLKPGQLFRFPNGYSSENVYMKVAPNAGGVTAVLLNNGLLYSPDVDRQVEIIQAPVTVQHSDAC